MSDGEGDRDWGCCACGQEDEDAQGAVGAGAVCVCHVPRVVGPRLRGIRSSTRLWGLALAEVAHGVDRVAVYSYFEVEVGAVGEARHADRSEGLAFLDGLIG